MSGYDYWKFGYSDEDDECKARQSKIALHGDDYALSCDVCHQIDNTLCEGDDCTKCESGIMIETY